VDARNPVVAWLKGPSTAYSNASWGWPAPGAVQARQFRRAINEQTWVAQNRVPVFISWCIYFVI
jgi:hypothetical protein